MQLFSRVVKVRVSNYYISVERQKLNDLQQTDSKYFKKQQEREVEVRKRTLEKMQMFEKSFTQDQIKKAESMVREKRSKVEVNIVLYQIHVEKRLMNI